MKKLKHKLPVAGILSSMLFAPKALNEKLILAGLLASLFNTFHR
jgi:hypothetical protein